MATPTLTRHALDGALGPIAVDVRAAGRRASAPAVLVHHGFKGFKDYSFIPVYADRLARAGFVAVTASMSGSGVDEAGDFTLLDRFRVGSYSRELDDLGVLMQALARGDLDVAPPSSVGIVGHSRGGGMALCVASETPAVRAVATWAAISRVRRHTDAELATWKEARTVQVLHQRTRQYLPLDYELVEDVIAHEHGRLDIVGAAASLDRPWLLVHGTADASVPVDEGYALQAAARGDQFESMFIDGADHVFGSRHPWEGASEQMSSVFDRTTRFLAQHLE